MIDLYNAATNQLRRTATGGVLNVVVGALEEEGVCVKDYFISTAPQSMCPPGEGREPILSASWGGRGGGGGGATPCGGGEVSEAKRR